MGQQPTKQPNNIPNLWLSQPPVWLGWAGLGWVWAELSKNSGDTTMEDSIVSKGENKNLSGLGPPNC